MLQSGGYHRYTYRSDDRSLVRTLSPTVLVAELSHTTAQQLRQ